MTVIKINSNIDKNIDYLEKLYAQNGDFISRKFVIGDKYNVEAYLACIDNMANATLIQETVLKPLLVTLRGTRPNMAIIKGHILNTMTNDGIYAIDLREENDLEKIQLAISSGDTALFIDKSNMALIIASRGFLGRGVPTADTEIVVQGSKDAFSESLRTNTMLIRRRIRDTELVIKQTVVGVRTKTDIAIVYIKDIARPDVVKELNQRIDKINIDAILDIGYIAQLIEEDFASPFPLGQVTERPDRASAAILEGRIVIIADNSPFVLMVPATLNCFFQSPEDYYQKYDIMSLSRILRYVACIVATTLPAIYIAITLYNPNMLPTQIMYKMAAARVNIPFPAIVEVLIMDTAFELLREAGLRLPSALGGTIGIIGGIIIGQAAVEAGIVSPIVVIVVALSGICSFTLPSISLVGAVRISKYVLLAISAAYGLFGFWIGALLILIHLSSLKSFGIPYMYPFVSAEANNYTDVTDTIVRLPFFMLNKRGIFSDFKARIKARRNNN